MSLHFILKINDTPIGAVTIQRTHPQTPVPAADDVCTYLVHRYQVDESARVAEVRHRYGDGAWSLAQAALEETAVRAGEET